MPGLDEVDVGGVIANDPNSVVQALYSGNTITPSANFNFPWLGQVLQFSQGNTAVVEPGLLAALTAAGAPFTTP